MAFMWHLIDRRVLIRKDPRRPIVFYDVRVHPMPIVTPGTVYLTFSGNITKDLPRGISVELGVVKYMIGIPFPLPCFDNHLGSCLYSNICANLAEYEYRGCPKKFKQYNIQCYCPFQAGDFSLRNLPLNIPKIGGFAGAFVIITIYFQWLRKTNLIS
ncbi:hypothetical protein ACJMK2_031258 [Sinanodonta woodiana]|uniref:MD-2-related lipid-recognition domain-containing protein n=1 Tax=Sinanodonta woodiana TaxID=1069815 RepID=A0ABD3WY83_SINWO